MLGAFCVKEVKATVTAIYSENTQSGYNSTIAGATHINDAFGQYFNSGKFCNIVSGTIYAKNYVDYTGLRVAVYETNSKSASPLSYQPAVCFGYATFGTANFATSTITFNDLCYLKQNTDYFIAFSNSNNINASNRFSFEYSSTGINSGYMAKIDYVAGTVTNLPTQDLTMTLNSDDNVTCPSQYLSVYNNTEGASSTCPDCINNCASSGGSSTTTPAINCNDLNSINNLNIDELAQCTATTSEGIEYTKTKIPFLLLLIIGGIILIIFSRVLIEFIIRIREWTSR